MTPLLPPVAVTELPDGARFRLPARPWGQPAWMGLGAIVGGVVGSGSCRSVCGARALRWSRTGGKPGDGMWPVFLLFGAAMLAMCMGIAVRGLSRVVGHNEIELRGDTLRASTAGPAPHGRRHHIVGLVRFAVRDALPDERPGRRLRGADRSCRVQRLTAIWGDDELLPGPRLPALLAHPARRRTRLAAAGSRPTNRPSR